MRLLLSILLFCGALLNTAQAQNTILPINVTFLVPADKSNPFWQLVERNIKVAAKQFSVNLNIIHIKNKADINRYHHLELSQSILQNTPNVDYFITAFHDGKTKELLELIEHSQTKYLSLVNNVSSNTLKETGLPREKYPHWIGEVVSDGEHAGHTLAQNLINKADKTHNINKIFVGISGARDHTTVRLRARGLKSILTKNEHYPLKKLVYSQRKPSLIQQQTERLYKGTKTWA